jgi:hypothetical protein
MRHEAITTIQDVCGFLRTYYKNTEYVYFDGTDVFLRSRDLGISVELYFKESQESDELHYISLSRIKLLDSFITYPHHHFTTPSLCRLADALVEHKANIRKNKIKGVIGDTE